MCSESKKILHSNYSKFFHCVVNCKSENYCCILDQNRVAHLLRVYSNNVSKESELSKNQVDSFQRLFQEDLWKKNDHSVFNSVDARQKLNSPALTEYSVVRQNTCSTLTINSVSYTHLTLPTIYSV